MKVLVSGTGIAGSTLAFWLSRYGLEPTIVERHRNWVAREVRIVNPSGKRISGFSVESLSRVVQGRYISLARSDLAASICNAIEGADGWLHH